MFALALRSVLERLVEEVPLWLALESVPTLGVVALFVVPVLLRFLAASSARVAAEGSVLTKVPVLGCGAAFCMASLASCGVTPMFVVGLFGVGVVCAQAPPAVRANVAQKAKSFIE